MMITKQSEITKTLGIGCLRNNDLENEELRPKQEMPSPITENVLFWNEAS